MYTTENPDPATIPTNAPLPGWYRLACDLTNPDGSKRKPSDEWDYATIKAGTLIYIHHDRNRESDVVTVTADTPDRKSRFHRCDSLRLGAYVIYTKPAKSSFSPSPHSIACQVRGSLEPCNPTTLTIAEILSIFHKDSAEALEILVRLLPILHNHDGDCGGPVMLLAALVENAKREDEAQDTDEGNSGGNE